MGSHRLTHPLRLFATAFAIALAGLGLTAAGAFAAVGTFSATDPLTIPAGAPGTTSGDADPFPALAFVENMAGDITDVDVHLENIGHQHPDDLDIVLESPSGDTVVLMSDACGSTDVEDFDWTFNQQAATPMLDSGPCNALFYQPSSYVAGDTWPAEVPGPHGTSLNSFNGENPNGAWSLYVIDDAGGDVGDIEGGWSLTVTTGPADFRIPATDTAGKAGRYPAERVVTGQTGVITDVNLAMNGLAHEHPDDLDMLLVSPHGEKVITMSDACGSYDIAGYLWRWDDEAPALMADGGSTNVCSAFSHRPTNHEGAETLPAPAPAGPYAATMAAFDLVDPNGTWKLYINDDAGGDAGYLVNPYTLEITTRPKAEVRFTESAAQVNEGATRQLTIARSGATPLGPATVALQTSGSAAAGDFSLSPSTVQFAAGEAQKTVELKAIADTQSEKPETVKVAILSTADDAVAAAPSTVDVTISDIPGDVTAPAFAVLSKKLVLGKGRKVRVKIGAPTNETGPTRGAVVLSAKLKKKGKAKVIGRRRNVTVQPGKALVTKVKISKKAAKVVRKRGVLRVKIKVTLRDGAGNLTTKTKTVKLRPKKKK